MSNLVEQLRQDIGDGSIRTGEDITENYHGDEYAGEEYRRAPEVVFLPSDETEVSKILSACTKHGIPVVPRGAGTGLSAGCAPSEGSVVVSTERLTSIIDKDVANRTITVGAGVPLSTLYEEVEDMDLFFPPHPGDEGALVGGTVATNAGGARAVKYGTIRRFVLGLQIVLSTGEILELGGKTLKSSTGYDLLDLVIGSEGTLCIVTRVTLSLLPKPGSLQTIAAPFDDVQKAIEAVPTILSKGILPFAVEFVEHSVIRCSERLLNKKWPANDGEASLLFILDGIDEDAVLGTAESIGEALEEAGATDVLLADKKENQADILSLRSMIYEALRPATVELFDICVPRSEIAPHVAFVHSLEERFGVSLPTYGHAADGNVHTHSLKALISDGEIGEEVPGWERTHIQVRDALYADAMERGGVISGEHGIGIVKREHLEANIGTGRTALMRSIKSAFDPKGILNPGKVLHD